MSIQVIIYKCCGNVFAACRTPECYTDAEWMKDVRKYAKQGHTVEMAESCVFGDCKCKAIAKLDNEPNLFNQ